MIDAVSAQMLAEIAARANDVLAAYGSGAEPTFSDAAGNANRILKNADPLSVATQDGYFVVERAGQRAYTRDGTFVFRDGALKTRGNEPVVGYASAQDRARAILTPLRADAADAALGRVNDLRIESDGAVAYTRSVRDAQTGVMRRERVTIGTLALARFPAGTQPVRIDVTHAGAPPGVVTHFGAAGDGNFAPLATHSRDAGGFDVDAALLHLQEAYRAFDAVQAAHAARRDVYKTTMDLVK